MAVVTVLTQACKGVEDCGICVFVCPKKLFRSSGRMNEWGYLPPELSDETECIGCGNCMIYCPDLAIVVHEEPGEEPQDG